MIYRRDIPDVKLFADDTSTFLIVIVWKLLLQYKMAIC